MLLYCSFVLDSFRYIDVYFTKRCECSLNLHEKKKFFMFTCFIIFNFTSIFSRKFKGQLRKLSTKVKGGLIIKGQSFFFLYLRGDKPLRGISKFKGGLKTLDETMAWILR